MILRIENATTAEITLQLWIEFYCAIHYYAVNYNWTDALLLQQTDLFDIMDYIDIVLLLCGLVLYAVMMQMLLWIL